MQTGFAAVLCSLATVLLLPTPGFAAVSHPYRTQFSGIETPAGSLLPFGLAVDNSMSVSSGDVYVVDLEHDVVDQFNVSGEYESQLTGTPSGPFGLAYGVATDQSTGDVYVADLGNGLVDKFNSSGEYQSQFDGSKTPAGSMSPTALAINQGNGDVYIADNANDVVDEFNSSGEYQSQLTGTPSGAFGSVFSVAVDNSSSASSGDIYVVDESNGVVDKFNSSGEYQSQLTGTGAAGGPAGSFSSLVHGVAIEQATGDVYVADEGDGVVDEFDPAGGYVTQFNGSATPAGSFSPFSVATNQTTGDVYVSDTGNGVVDVFGTIIVPEVTTTAASNVSATAATLNGTINPDGVPVTSCAFEYGATEGNYTHTVPCSQGLPLSGEEPVMVSANLTGLQSDTVYHYRLVATNANGGTDEGHDEALVTRGPFIGGEFTTDVTATSAVLQAELNPEGSGTTYQFEYDTSEYDGATSHGERLPVPDGTVGEGAVDITVRARPQNLRPATTYHYRVVAIDNFGTFPGPDHTFTTQPAGSESALLDGRVWEQVSPPEEDSAGLEPLGETEGVIQSSEDGNALAYVANAPVGAEPLGNLFKQTQVLSTRSASGWSTQDITTPTTTVTGFGIGEQKGFQMFSPELAHALVEPKSETALSPEATEQTPYVRNDVSGSYIPLITAGNVPPNTTFGEHEHKGGVHFDGASPDLSHVVMSSDVALTSVATQAGGLYDWTAGQLLLVSRMPTAGKPAPHPALGYINRDVRHAISNDGSRIIWSEEGGEGLYVSDVTNGETIEIDAVEREAEGGQGKPDFQTASSDGSRIFFTDTARLTLDSTAEPEEPDLYVFEVDSVTGPLTGRLTDLTVDEHAGEHADVQGAILGASEDGSYVYFVANGALAAGAASGTCGSSPPAKASCNLYVREYNGGEWTPPTFIASLSGEDQPDWGGSGFFAISDLDQVTSRVAPDGIYLAFMSEMPLTGYDNIDANPEARGARDEEVFLYDATTQHLVCASCNPAGSRPVGLHDTGETPRPLVDAAGVWGGRWLGGNVPGWSAVAGTRALYQSRYLADDGRLFFNSPADLIPQATNGKEDVYEYEPPGIGSCTSSSVLFSERSEGCIGLISSGSSGEESAFLDASEDGDDAFFLSAAELVPEDREPALGIYDAHVCSGAVLCPSAPATTAQCAGDACQGLLEPTPSLPSVGSISQVPGENVVVADNKVSAQKKIKPKPLTTEQRLRKALNACRAKYNKRKQVSCEKQAEERYLRKALNACRAKNNKRKRASCEKQAQERYPTKSSRDHKA